MPKPPSAFQFPTKVPEAIATSLHFLANKNNLLVTYATNGIVYVVAFLPDINLTCVQSLGYFFYVDRPQDYPKDVPNVREAAVLLFLSDTDTLAEGDRL